MAMVALLELQHSPLSWCGIASDGVFFVIFWHLGELLMAEKAYGVVEPSNSDAGSPREF